MSEETFVPLNDSEVGLRRKSSFGSNKDLTVEHAGEHDSVEYRLHAVHAPAKKRVSLWHDINLIHIDHTTKKSTNCLNFVCEIPKFTRYVLSENCPTNIFLMPSRITLSYYFHFQEKVRNCY